MNVTFWLEITIAGAVYLLAAFFWVLVSLGLSDEQFGALSSQTLKEYLPYAAVAFAAASYVVGILANRVIQLTPRRLINPILTFLSPEPAPPVVGERSNMVRIWQYGSERLHRELDFQYSLVVLIRSLLFSVPLFGAGVATWLYSSKRAGVWQTVILASLIWLACVLALRRQWQNYSHTEMVAASALRAIEAKATQEPKGDEKGEGSRDSEAPNSGLNRTAPLRGTAG
jgi:hypothetical protein